MELQLTGKRALVTGASSGIGRTTAMMLAAEGVKVVVHGRDSARAQEAVEDIRSLGGAAAMALGDLSVANEAKAVARAAAEAFGGIDILVNNAAAPSDPKLGAGFFDLDPELWVDTYRRNVISCYALVSVLVSPMKQRGWGRIIQITSDLSFNPRGLFGDYAASKAALNNFTFNLSQVLAKTGVTVNGVAPGFTKTPATLGTLAAMAERAGLGRDPVKGEAYYLEHLATQTVGRLGQPEDVAGVITFLSSPRADYINGTTLRVDGGRSGAVH